MNDDRNRVCPVELANSLDNVVRRWLQDPRKILSPFVREGMTVLDVGCGPGFFAVEAANLVGPRGKVVAADLQEGMLEKLRKKVYHTPLADRIKPVVCEPNRINVSDAIDFVLAFWMVHEVKDKESFFKQLFSILKDGGSMLVVEPKLFHVSHREFGATLTIAEDSGFGVSPGPRVIVSWSAVLIKSTKS